MIRRAEALSLLAAACFSGWAAAAPAPAAGAAAPSKAVKDGVVVEFEARPLEGAQALMEGVLADIRFRITEEATGAPVKGVVPSAWMDMGHVIQGQPGAEKKECRDKVSLYLQGIVGIRPMLDLSGYHVMILNKDSSITVIDPLVSMTGKTSTLAAIMLKRPGMDWVKSLDGRRLYVSMPVAGEVAVVDTESLQVAGNIAVGQNPVRVALQPDGRYLWVGNDARDAAASGVAVIDTRSGTKVKFLPTGRGHHEIAFSADSRHAFVSNRDEGTVSVIDVAGLTKLRDIRTGELPIALAWSELSRSLYVADARLGTISVIDGRSLQATGTIAAKPGLGPLRFSPDGRFGFALNTTESTVSIIDTGANEIIARADVAADPYEVQFTRGFAYVRGLSSERVTMINLSSIGKGKTPIVQSFPAGSKAPRLAGDLPIAGGLAAARVDNGVFAISPADNATYFYMEGMNAPASSYENRGHAARAVTVVDRSLKEVEPGVFSTRVRIPAEGRYDVALLLDQPRVTHCFSAQAQANPAFAEALRGSRVHYLLEGGRQFRVKAPVSLRFKLADSAGRPRAGLSDVKVRYFLAPTSRPLERPAKEVGEGVYEAELQFPARGTYFIHVAAPSIELGFGEAGYAAVQAVEGDSGAAKGGGPSQGSALARGLQQD